LGTQARRLQHQKLSNRRDWLDGILTVLQSFLFFYCRYVLDQPKERMCYDGQTLDNDLPPCSNRRATGPFTYSLTRVYNTLQSWNRRWTAMREGKEHVSTGAVKSSQIRVQGSKRLSHAYVSLPGTPGSTPGASKRRKSKTIGNSIMSSFTSEYLTMSEYLTRLLPQNSTEFAQIAPTLAVNIILGHHFEVLGPRMRCVSITGH